MSRFMHPLRHAVLATLTFGACSLSLMAMAQAGSTGNPPVVYKRHLLRAPYFNHLSGAAAAWANGRCDRPLRSEFPPCMYPAFPEGSQYYYSGRHLHPIFNDE